MKRNPQKKTTKKKKAKQAVQEEETPSTTTLTEFSFAIIQVAVSQICRSVGFAAAEGSALQTLTLVATKYLQEIAQLAVSYSHAANRTESNVFDLINALQDLYLIPSAGGFVGASTLQNTNKCLLSSSVLKDVLRFVKYTDEIPFAKPVPREKRLSNALVSCGNERGLHIPKWLPDFPNVNTYKECKESVCRKGGELWENSEVVHSSITSSGGGGSSGFREERLRSDLGMERGRAKVMFRIGGKEGKEVGGGDGVVGMDMRNGVCRGGKRVRWNSSDDDYDDSNFGFKR